MDGLSISQVAARTGFPASTLRFYEQAGMVRPARTAAGYRSYDEREIERLAFIGRAKGFGLSLDQITELLGLLDDDRCGPVQDRLRDVIDAKVADARDRIDELVTFTEELKRVAASLRGHTPAGPCDDTCACTSDPPGGAGARVVATPLADDAPPIACTLAAPQVEDRLREWQGLLGAAVGRDVVPDGVRLRFARGVDVVAVATLVAAEQDCCRFLDFTLRLGVDEVALEVTGSRDAQPIIEAVFGSWTRPPRRPESLGR